MSSNQAEEGRAVLNLSHMGCVLIFARHTIFEKLKRLGRRLELGCCALFFASFEGLGRHRLVYQSTSRTKARHLSLLVVFLSRDIFAQVLSLVVSLAAGLLPPSLQFASCSSGHHDVSFRARKRGRSNPCYGESIPMKSCKGCTQNVFPTDAFLNLDGCHYHARCARCKDCGCKITLQNFTAPSEGGAVLLCKIHYVQHFREGGAYAGDEKFAKSSSTINRTMTPPHCVQPVPEVGLPQEENQQEQVLAAQNDDEDQGAPTTPACGEPTITEMTSNFAGMVALNGGSDEADAAEAPAEEAAAIDLLPIGEKEGLQRGNTDGGAATGSGSTDSRKENACHVCEKTVYAADPQLILGRFKYHKACAKCDDCKTKITLSNSTAPSQDGHLLCSVHFKARFQQEGRYRGGEQFKHKA